MCLSESFVRHHTTSFLLFLILTVDKNNSHFNCVDPMQNRELLQKAIYHGNQLMGASLMKNFLFVFIPESIRYFFNLTTYPRETDTFLSFRVEKITRYYFMVRYGTLNFALKHISTFLTLSKRPCGQASKRPQVWDRQAKIRFRDRLLQFVFTNY